MAGIKSGRPDFATDVGKTSRLPPPAVTLSVEPEKSGEGVYPSIEAAKQAVREIIANSLKPGGVAINLSAGEYSIKDSLVFDDRDSGNSYAPVVWQADKGAKVVLQGGAALKLSDFVAVSERDPLYGRLRSPGKVLVADLGKKGIAVSPMEGGYGQAYRGKNKISDPENGEPAAWTEVFYNGQPMTLARYPSSGYVTVERAETDPNPDLLPAELSFGYGDARPEGWKDITNVYLHGYFRFDWSNAVVRIGSFDAKTKTITTAEKISYGVKAGMRYFYLNIPEELTEPGEWYLDSTTKRLYIIPPDNSADPDIRITTTTAPLVVCENASHIAFKGIDFAYTRGTGAVVRSGESLRFMGCRFYNIGNIAIRMGDSPGTYSGMMSANGGLGHLVESCDIWNTGFGGIYIYAGDRDTLTPSNIAVKNCDIHDFARIGKCYCHAVNIVGVGITAANNRMHAAPHAAIYFWGNDNIIEYNEFYDLLREADDAAAVYCGRDYTLGGNVIRYNFFHDMQSNANSNISVFGTYCDDNSAGIAYYGNVYYRMQGVHLSHGGHDIYFENNLIVDKTENSTKSTMFVKYGYPRSLKEHDPTTKDVGQHIKYLRGVAWQSPLWKLRFPHIREYLEWDPDDEQVFPHYCTYVNNVYVRHLPLEPNFPARVPSFHNTIKDNLFTEEDVGFVDKERMNFALREDSPVFNQLPDFKPIPFEKIGLYKDEFRERLSDT